jgi:plasmid stability protein
MAVMTIRNIDDALKARLRIRAAMHGRSMEDEARDILRSALSSEVSRPRDLGRAIHERFAALGGVDLPEVPRDPGREPPGFEA